MSKRHKLCSANVHLELKCLSPTVRKKFRTHLVCSVPKPFMGVDILKPTFLSIVFCDEVLYCLVTPN